MIQMEQERVIGALVMAVVPFFIVGLPGIRFFRTTYENLRKKRAMEDFPTSSIRSMAMGLVELSGRTEKKETLRGPLSGEECVYYEYVIEKCVRRYRNKGLRSEWIIVARGDSSRSHFWINDTTGAVMVLPLGAQTDLKRTFSFELSAFRRVPQTLRVFMEKNKIDYKGFFGLKDRMSFSEWCIKPEEAVYVIGTAQKSESLRQEYPRQLQQRLDTLKTTLPVDPAAQEEWAAVAQRVERELLETKIARAGAWEPGDVVIGRSDADTMFMITNRGEKALARRLGISSFVAYIVSFVMIGAWLSFVAGAILMLVLP